jgi:hypothetical protein
MMVSKALFNIFGLIGLGFLVIALIFGITTQLFISQASVAQGTVIGAASPDSGRRSSALIRFSTSDGQVVQFNSPVQSNPPEFHLGQTVRVYYNLSDPQSSARPDSWLSLWFWTGLAGLLGLVFGLVGAGFFSAWYLNYRKQKWLQRHGQRLTAVITAIRQNTHVRNRGKSPYVIEARPREPRKGVNYFKSGNLWDNPAPLIPGDEISVLIDPRNARRYLVEITGDGAENGERGM